MRTIACPTLVVLALNTFGCEKQESTERSAEPVASVDKAAAIDPALAKAVAQASAARPNQRGPRASTPGQPPPSGVFEPGEADREAARGSAPKITLGDRGAEPRVTLGPSQPKPGWKTAGTAQVMLQQADPRQQTLPVTVALSLEAQKPKPADADAGAPSAAAGAVTVLARVTGAEVSATGIPQEIADKVSALKGAKIEYQVASDGSGSGFRYELASKELVDYLRALSDALALVTLPMPKEPLGKGGYFMTTSREGIYGLDLVTYRMVKVEQIDGEKITLSVGTRRYAADRRFDFPGLGADVPKDLVEFEAKSEARLEFRAGASFPLGGEVGSALAARLGTAQQSGLLQIQSKVGLAFPDKSGPGLAAKKPATAAPAAPITGP